ncbi:methionine aminopeptidase [Leucobacter sp. UT-8R-CII-1-4]|uniref:methionine aminopeptidase n=1 Tax=Leucobacter sp. UT-8R-CII-1-4 TaxID=3040075 RepID=UPI0024A9DFA2|nr:methionine aminopeptidase [Leucobacter sp. UT-8R-CII-1-4]MDI6024283.1 methionine aminopeptidase [Leucobacter sp. UT-8R-CII-1-4]
MSKKDWGIEDSSDTFWYNTRSGEVEEGPQSLSIDRLGPFVSREEAARAPEIIAERARRIREEDELED